MYFSSQGVIKRKVSFTRPLAENSESDTLNIAYGIDKNFMFGCAISAASILLHNPDIKFSFHIFTDSLGDDEEEKFQNLSTQYNADINLYIVNCDELKSLPSTKNWSYATYFRFVIADLLYPEIETLLYIDADIVCKGSLHELLGIEFNNNIAAVVAEEDKVWWEKRAKALDEPGINAGYFNAGFLYINLAQWQKNDISSQAMSLLADEKVKSKISYLDQDILNILLIDKTTWLDKKYNTQYSINYELSKPKPVNPIKDDTVMIHYIGPTKPWHKWAENYACTEYFLDAKSASPWAKSPLLKAMTTSNMRYCAKHQFHNGRNSSAIYFFIMYLTKKIYNIKK
ncbi:lipopolysaccharide 3-alpha-galactosyltransferase [Pectobacterium aquaticum]|uniref:lipopolysaccharide 3-alpha-galactosyltransferase n=1 Tax=Pectobacterium aquaticum TaxID=2204145 RepID=UPI001F0E76A8|nr:lipopolysaccharide 3-alpha-galactosyltransferase [Pectobacterium aquaticum]MCH5051446.1 lipopolysaccharide 3-alpha-galactosyltransferase [Pectobacterium aquaticum]